MPSRPLTRRMFKRQRIGHVARGVAYRVGNSFRGLRAMKRFGYKAVDRDLRKTKDGVIVVDHWGRPGHQDKMRAPGVPANMRIEDMTWPQVASLRGPDGTRIHRVEADIDLLAQLRLVPYFEPKAPRSMKQADWDHVVAYCHLKGVRPHGYTLRANAAQLPLMRRAGVISPYRLGK